MRNIRIDGKVPSNQRQSLVDKFQARVSNVGCIAWQLPVKVTVPDVALMFPLLRHAVCPAQQVGCALLCVLGSALRCRALGQ